MPERQHGQPVRIEGPAEKLIGVMSHAGFAVTPGTASEIASGEWVVFGYATSEAILALQAAGHRLYRLGPMDEQPEERAAAMSRPPANLVRVTASQETLNALPTQANLCPREHGATRLPDGRWEIEGEATDAAVEALRMGGCEVEMVVTAAELLEQKRNIQDALRKRQQERRG
jgi:hypothetical protein